MAEVSDYIVAIDIGTSNVVTLVGERAEDGKIRIVSSSITPSGGMARGDVRNVEQIVASIE
ncbi:MAG: cell division protein FtsA, partial [Rikenellaceae bacterium]